MFAYNFSVSDDRRQDAILIAASLICAVRLVLEEIKPSPKVYATIQDAIKLAEMIWQRMNKN